MSAISEKRVCGPVLLIAMGVLLAPAAWPAQDAGAGAAAEVAAIRARIAGLGRSWNAGVVRETTRLYAGLHRQRDSSAIRRTLDVSYGPDAAHKLDVYVPDQGFDEPGPVLVFLHDSDAFGSGRSVAGTDGLMYGNVARALARAGGVGINAGYRSGVDALSEQGARDVRHLVEWVHANVARHGGDPGAVIVMGHGEGALRLASWLFRQSAQPAGGPAIAGAILAGGSFDTSRFWRLLEAHRGSTVPLLLWSSELDPVESGVVALKDRLCARQGGNCPMLAELKGHNRASAVMSFDTADVSAMGSIVHFYHSVVRK